MPSPFPGMNPYLEQEAVWHDFHQTFIPTARELLSAQVRPGYVVKVEVRHYVHPVPPEERGPAGPFTDVERDCYLEIRTTEGDELVTVLELLEPTTKRPGSHRDQYLAACRRVLAGGADLVEIDLLRGGVRMPPETLPDCDYRVVVSQTERNPITAVWPVRLRDPLPVIPVPLCAPDPDARLDLKAVLDRVYDGAGYPDYIYGGRPHPPLHPQDAEWARQFLPT